MFRCYFIQGLRLAAAQGLGPGSPRAGLELAAQLGVQSIIVQPGRLRPAELLELSPLPGKFFPLRPTLQKIPRRLVKQGKLPLFNLVEIHASTSPGQPANPLSLNPAPIRQKLKADEIRVARKRR